MSEEKKEHPAKRMGEIIETGLYYFRRDILAGMLEVNDSVVFNFLEGIHGNLTDDQIFIIPYLMNLKSDAKEEYAKLHAECKNWPKLGLADVFIEADLNVKVTLHKNVYRTIELTDSQKKQIARIVLGKKKLEEVEQEELAI